MKIELEADDELELDERWLTSKGFVSKYYNASGRHLQKYFTYRGIHITHWDTGWRVQVGSTDGMWEYFDGKRKHVKFLLMTFDLQLMLDYKGDAKCGSF